MSIFYVILSCKPFLETRLKWQRASWLSGIDSYIVLTGAIGSTDPKVACMNTGDGYETCPNRYYQYIRENDLSAYDWIVFVDDDTFIFPKRLENYLATQDASKSLYIGRSITWPIKFMSGGAGFALSRVAYNELKEYLTNSLKQDVEFHKNGDVTMGIWINKIAKATHVNCKYLSGNRHKENNMGALKEAFSFHYVTEELFKFYGELI